ncbi:hypothetical protein AO382_1855 [Moraxella catarrhalis]|uniref:Uncharacterized protein n=1 Tax=Moraxella catarrhalis TaxID=480 RepID=A0A7Z0UX66_MORCA|nr:hypothetical protein AO382_1855 [Moraxella catarrhalis]
MSYPSYQAPILAKQVRLIAWLEFTGGLVKHDLAKISNV